MPSIKADAGVEAGAGEIAGAAERDERVGDEEHRANLVAPSSPPDDPEPPRHPLLRYRNTAPRGDA